MRPAAFVLSLLLTSPLTLQGQSLTGRVTDATSGASVAGTVVELLSMDSTRVQVTLSRDDGSYVLRVPRGGPYLLRAGSLGYADLLIGPLTFQGDDTQDLRLAPAPVRLEGLRASAGTRCAPTPGEAGQTARLWEEVSRALDVTRIAQDQELFDLEQLRFARDLVPARDYLVRESSDLWRGSQAFRGMPLSTVLEEGFIEESGGRIQYYLPTPSIILSDGFREEHCFHVETRAEGQRRLVGLAFIPVEDLGVERVSAEREDERPRRSGSELLDPRGADVEGVLWVDAATGRLETLEYRYVGIELPAGSPEAGGYARFERLPNGVWVVRRWLLRMPTLSVSRGGGGFELVGVREEGGELVSARGPDGEGVPLGGGVRLEGRVLVEQSTRSMPGATVMLSGTSVSSEADEEGRFVLEGVVPGPHLAAVYHPILDTLGIPLPAVPVDVTAEARSLVISFPERSRVIDYLCPNLSEGDGHLLVALDPAPDGRQASVRVEAPLSGGRWDGQTDAQGRARFCHVPRGEPLEVRATWPRGGGTGLGAITLASRLGLLVLEAF